MKDIDKVATHSHLPKSCQKEHADANFLSQRHVQSPYQAQRQQQKERVADDAKDGHGHEDAVVMWADMVEKVEQVAPAQPGYCWPKERGNTSGVEDSYDNYAAEQGSARRTVDVEQAQIEQQQ